jgi:hypothetical protein
MNPCTEEQFYREAFLIDDEKHLAKDLSNPFWQELTGLEGLELTKLQLVYWNKREQRVSFSDELFTRRKTLFNAIAEIVEAADGMLYDLDEMELLGYQYTDGSLVLIFGTDCAGYASTNVEDLSSYEFNYLVELLRIILTR